MARERPLWEAHVIEGLNDGRIALYTKVHHSLVDGVSSMRLLQSVLSSDPDERDMPAPWAARPRPASTRSEEHTSELQSLMRISYAVFCLKQKTTQKNVRTS